MDFSETHGEPQLCHQMDLHPFDLTMSVQKHILAAEASFGLYMKKKSRDHSVVEILEEIPRAVIPALPLSCLL